MNDSQATHVGPTHGALMVFTDGECVRLVAQPHEFTGLAGFDIQFDTQSIDALEVAAAELRLIRDRRERLD